MCYFNCMSLCVPLQEKKGSSGSISVDPTRPKTVTVFPPGQKTAKPTTSKKVSLKADLVSLGLFLYFTCICNKLN